MRDEKCRCGRDIIKDDYGWWCPGCNDYAPDCTCDPPREPGDSWLPHDDLGAVYDGQDTDPPPMMLERTDGKYLFYNGKIHTVSGEPESLKTWLVLLAAADVINHGHPVLFIDYEDTAAGIVGRLKALGCTRDAIVGKLYYVRPDEPYGPQAAEWLTYDPGRPGPVLAVIDGVTEAMAAHGLDPNSNTDVAAFNARLPKALACPGRPVVMIDHVTKSREGRGRWAIGAQHKKAGVDGAAYIIELLKPFGHGLHGIAKIVIAKDRPGRVREHSPIGVAGILHLRSELDGSVLAEIRPPREDQGGESGEFRPTILMERISRICEAQPGLTKSALIAAAKGHTDHKKLALELLVREGFITEKKDGNSYRHLSACPFRQPGKEQPDP